MRTRYRVLGMLVLLSIITYLDRVALSAAASTMKQDLGISTADWGWVTGAFLLSYGLFEIPTGAAGDRWGQRKTLTRIVIWWSVFTSLTGVVSNYWLLLATRFAFGAGEAGAYPNASGSVARWFPSGERARAQGFIWGASRIGGALSPLLVIPIINHFNWRWAFISFGALGVIWAFGWYFWYRDWPKDHPAVTPEELDEIGVSAIRAEHHNVPWRRLFSSLQLWLIMLMYWSYVCGGIIYTQRLGEYLVDGRGFSNDEMKYTYAMAFLMGAMGNFVAGYVSDRLARTHGPWVGYCVLGAVSLVGAGLCLLATALTTGKLSGAIFLILGFGVMDCMLPAAWAAACRLGGQYAGAVSGAMNSAGQAGGFLFVVLYGHMVAAFGDFHLPLIPMAVMMFISAGVFLLVDPTRPLIPAESLAQEQPACA